jgi:hypothetical protein
MRAIAKSNKIKNTLVALLKKAVTEKLNSKELIKSN